VKLADFGLAYQDIFEGQESQFNVRWAAPEIWRKIMDLADEESDGISSSSSSDDEESPSDTNEEEEVDIDSKMFLKVHDSSKTSSTLSKNSRSGVNYSPFILYFCLMSLTYIPENCLHVLLIWNLQIVLEFVALVG